MQGYLSFAYYFSSLSTFPVPVIPNIDSLNYIISAKKYGKTREKTIPRQQPNEATG